MRSIAWILCTLILSQGAALAQGEGSGPGESTNGLDMQKARSAMMNARGKRVAYTKVFDLSGLPEYTPTHKVSGTIRLWGSNYITDGNLGRYWEEGFRKYHPGVKLSWHMKTTEAAVPSLVFGVSDIGIGRKLTFSELQLFQRYKDRSPLEIDIATGSYDIPGWNPGFGVIVSKDNPLTRITMQQLDGIFGAERTGGWDGTSWVPTAARGPEQNLRTWGQLGLTGEWADEPINVYGLNLRYHQATEISDRVLKSSDKWNEKLRIYANYVTKDGKLSRGMNQDLAADKFGIGIVAAPTTNLTGGNAAPNQKILPLALTDAGPYVPYTLENIQNRSYPMYDHIFAYADIDPRGTADANVIEFLKYIVSRQGQEAVMRDGKYLPLPSTVATKQAAKVDNAEH